MKSPRFILSLCAAAVAVLCLLPSCSKDDDAQTTQRDVTYSVAVPSSDEVEFILKGKYTDATGVEVTISERTPWSLTIKDFPKNVMCGFEGYLYSLNASSVSGSVSLEISGNGGLLQLHNITASSGNIYTAEQLKILTSFSLYEGK